MKLAILKIERIYQIFFFEMQVVGYYKIITFDFPGGPVRRWASNVGSPGSIPGQGIQIPHPSTKSLHAATKTQCS